PGRQTEVTGCGGWRRAFGRRSGIQASGGNGSAGESEFDARSAVGREQISCAGFRGMRFLGWRTERRNLRPRQERDAEFAAHRGLYGVRKRERRAGDRVQSSAACVKAGGQREK